MCILHPDYIAPSPPGDPPNPIQSDIHLRWRLSQGAAAAGFRGETPPPLDLSHTLPLAQVNITLPDPDLDLNPGIDPDPVLGSNYPQGDFSPPCVSR